MNPPTHPPNYTPIHGCGSLHRFQILKRNWNISISSSAIELWLILGVPPGRWGGGWMGVGVVRGYPPHTCTRSCMHACTCMRVRVWHHRESPGFPQIQWGQPFAWNYHVYHVHACACVHVHICGGHPPPTPIHRFECRWGCPIPNGTFYVFDPKRCSCDPPIKKILIFALDSIRPYLDWALRGFLTS